MNDWLSSLSAEKFFAQEQQSFKRLSQALCGQIGVQLTCTGQYNYLNDINVSSKYKVLQMPESSSIELESVQKSNEVVADLEALPFSSNEFAVVIVPQMNLFSVDPYACLLYTSPSPRDRG